MSGNNNNNNDNSNIGLNVEKAELAHISNTNSSVSAPGNVDEKSTAANEGGLFDANTKSSSEQNGSGGEEPSSGDEKNILAQYDEETVRNMGRNFSLKYNLGDEEIFANGAALARSPKSYNRMSFLDDEQKQALHDEIERPWKIPWKLWQVVLAVSLAAATQGADESVINGAQLAYPKYMHIDNGDERSDWLQGLVNSSPYLFCAFISTFITDPLNRRYGRKRVIFWSCFVSSITCFWQAFTNKWYHLFIARAFLGAFGIGPKSATVPVYSSEAAPASIRGALTMLWQFFTAAGIALGYVFSIAFYYVPSHGIGGGLNWRLMLGSAMLPATIALFQIPFIPESPRWLMGKGRYGDAYNSLKSIRTHEICAARDLFYQYVLFQEEESFDVPTLQRVKELFTIRRNRNATIASLIVTFMQQFCGVNVIAYYSSTIFVEADFAEINALGASLGFGALNTVFAIPAFYTIDKYGRRFLLLATFPFMAAFLFLTGFSFYIPTSHRSGRIGSITLGIYLFTVFYSFGSGVVTFPYTAECFPLYVRTLGTSIAIGNLWFWNFILAITWPSLKRAFTSQGAFGWYAGWNIVGFFLVLWFLPETKSLTLEELDEVFDVPTMQHAKYQTIELWHQFQIYVLRRKGIKRQPPLYHHERMAVTSAVWEDKAGAEQIE